MSPRGLVEPAARVASLAECGRSVESPVGESGPVLLLWGWSRVDGRAHAIDPGGEHPALVYLARCGHRLLRRSVLCEVPPGRRCPVCSEGFWSISESGREFIDLLSATVALGALWSVLAEVVVLADEAANLSDEQLRAALVSLGRSCRADWWVGRR